MLDLDHIAVSGETLDDATAAVETALGVQMQPGGKHSHFGTHNTLLGLADGLYLEAIAADPDAPSPDRPRWFDLDRLSGPARLTNWICRTDDLPALLSRLDHDAGQPVSLARGALAWDMAVPADGRLPFDNRHPAFIQWNCAEHPADMLAPSGCRLTRLVVAHPEAAALQQALKPVFADPRVVFEPGPSAMMADFDTPHGRRTLR